MATSDSTPKTIQLQLSRGYVAIIDECDADLADKKWHAHVSSKRRAVYAVRNEFDQDGKVKFVSLHRVILERVLDRQLERWDIVDHRDCDGLNNCRDNLRLSTHSQNLSNSQLRKDSTSGFKGVTHASRGKRWAAQIRVNGKLIHLGYYKTPEEAHEVYLEASRKYKGEFTNPG